MSQEKIEKLTPEQETLIPVYREKWRKLALSTEPINREKAKEAMKKIYALIRLPEPKILFFNSPCEAERIFKYLLKEQQHYKVFSCEVSFKINTFQEKMWSQIMGYHPSELQEEILDRVVGGIPIELVTGLVSMCNLSICLYRFDIAIQEWAIYDAILSFYVNEFNLNYSHKLKEWAVCQSIVKNCGWTFPFEKICFICDRPRILSFDNQQRLHAEGTPAIQFADGYSLYAYHGVRLPEKYGKLHPNQWEAKWIIEEDNAELRRVLIQGIGYERIAQELGAIELDSYQESTLLKIDTDIDVEPISLLKMACPSTGFIHALRVPPDVGSAQEAIAWVDWGINPEEFSVQT